MRDNVVAVERPALSGLGFHGYRRRRSAPAAGYVAGWTRGRGPGKGTVRRPPPRCRRTETRAAAHASSVVTRGSGTVTVLNVTSSNAIPPKDGLADVPGTRTEWIPANDSVQVSPPESVWVLVPSRA